MTADGNDLVCPDGHRFVCVDGYFDLWPTDAGQPDIDWFATPYGLVYDRAIKERWLARLGGRLGWGADIGEVFAMMDEGVKCDPGEGVLDVPLGGSAAAGSSPIPPTPTSSKSWRWGRASTAGTSTSRDRCSSSEGGGTSRSRYRRPRGMNFVAQPASSAVPGSRILTAASPSTGT